MWRNRIPRNVSLMARMATLTLRLAGHPEAEFYRDSMVKDGKGGFWVWPHRDGVVEVFLRGNPPRPITLLECYTVLRQTLRAALGEDAARRVQIVRDKTGSRVTIDTPTNDEVTKIQNYLRSRQAYGS